MRTSQTTFRSLTVSLLLAVCGLLNAASAQTTPVQPADPSSQQQQPPRPTVILPEEKGPAPVAGKTELYCAGYIQYAPMTGILEIVGGEQEQEQRVYTEGDYVYINAGSQQGVRVGQEYSVIRPRGELNSPFTKKKGWLGVYVQEIGQLRVTEVKERVSVALVVASCETMLIGDFLKPASTRVVPEQRQEVKLDRFADPSGKQQGRIVLSRDGRELLTQNQIVFIDLGAEDNVKVGDYLTVYRPAGKGNISPGENEEFAVDRATGFGSETFRGTEFSNQSQRAKDYSGKSNKGIFFGPAITSREVKSRRPPMPRKVVGELVILSVQTRTATAVITRITQEVHTGDFVEVQ